MKKFYYFLFIFFCLFLFSCKTKNNNTSKMPSSTALPSEATTEKPINTTTKPNDVVTFDDLYDINNKIRIEIIITDSELIKLQKDYQKYSSMNSKSPIYRMCDVNINVTKNEKTHTFFYEQVGIRMKGNTSRTNFIDEDTNEIYNNIHLKLSFDELFDDPLYYNEDEILNLTESEKLIRSEREFLGQSALDLRYNKAKDSSYIKEYYALEMFRNYGVISQHSNFSEICIKHGNKTTEYGLYLMTEAGNKELIKNSLKSDTNYIGFSTWKKENLGTFGVTGKKYGQLYKASYGLGNIVTAPNMTSADPNLFGIEDEYGYRPPYELKTNKDLIDNNLIMTTINTIINGDYSAISEVVDLDYFAMYEAVATILGSPDDLRNNANNYMLYFRRTDGKMTIIPIDQDRVLGIGSDWNPTGDNMTSINQYSKIMAATNQNQVNNLYLKTILSDTDCKEKYLNNINTILNSEWVTNEKFTSIYNVVYKNYKDYVKTTLCNVEFSLTTKDGNLSFNEYITKKIAALKKTDSNENNTNNGDCINMNNIDSIYLAGYKNWDFDDEYKFTKNNNTYSLSFVIEKEFEFKIRVKYDNGTDEWYSPENGEILKKGGNKTISGDYIGRKATFTIDENGYFACTIY